MALKKRMRTHDGVVAEYHRVYQLVVRTNELVEIWVRSYVNASERKVETSDEEDVPVWSENSCYQVPFEDGPLTIEEAYAWLLSELPEFAGATDC